MAKARVSSVVPGQVGDIQREAAQAAVAPPPQTTSQLDALAEGTPVAPSAPPVDQDVVAGVEAGLEAEQRLGEQREREAVQPIQERYADRERVDVYDYSGERAKKAAALAQSGPSADGGLAARAANMAEMVTAGHVGLRTAAGDATTPILQKTGALEGKQVNYDFLKVASVVTENTLADLAFNEGLPDVTPEPGTGEGANIERQQAVSKTRGSANLGHQIHRDWQRMRNAAEGRPTDEFEQLSTEEATILGDAAKELYYETNKVDEGEQFLIRTTTEDGQVAFMLTKHGADRLKQGAPKRKRLFPKQHVRPAKAPLPGGQFVGEGRLYTKRVSGKAGKPLAGAETIQRAASNLNKVANVVDPQRLKILLATALPVLGGKVDPDHVFAGMNHVGMDKMDQFRAKATLDNQINPAEEYASLVNNLAQSIFGVAQEKDGANFLTYYIQAFNGRLDVQQTHFNPTASKSVRFVTRNAVPAKASPGSRVERNLRQMYAMMLVPGADAALPNERDKMLDRNTTQLARWGAELRSALNGITDQHVQKVVDAIKAGVPVTDPNFPQLPPIEIKDETLIAAIKKKGEDGQAFVDGLIDFANYWDNKKAGKPHFSYFNAYMDGKTNGLASNGLQMGSEKVAFKTGVLRSQGKRLLDNDEDIRDELAKQLVWSLDDGFDGDVDKFNGELHSIARKLYTNRDLNKATTMTFGYGMELNSFKKTIDEHLAEMEQGDPELATSVQLATDATSREELIDVLHGKYVGGLEQALDENALKSRALMRSAAILHAVTNEMFSIESSTGFELNMGGTMIDNWKPLGEYKVWEDGGYKTRTAGQLEQRPTSAAPKRRIDEETGEVKHEFGGIAYGGSVPAPVQSLDAATVALTASGRSWARLENASNGNPYLHTIYDAFKVDAMGYDVVLDEVNKNWLNAGLNWSYLEETRNAMDSLREKWGEKVKGIPDTTPVDPQQWAMAGYLLQPTKAQSGRMYPGVLSNKLEKLMEREEDGYEASWRIVKGMREVGYDFLNPPDQPTMGQLKTFIKLLSQEIDLAPRLNRMINETNNKKKALRSKIKSAGAPVYQYYSH